MTGWIWYPGDAGLHSLISETANTIIGLYMVWVVLMITSDLRRIREIKREMGL